jgi:anti-sigma regulatory factor (Ser/Thr protein kinase)
VLSGSPVLRSRAPSAAERRFVVVLVARPGPVGVARRRFDRWLERTGIAEHVCQDAVLVAHEALANAADHAYRAAPEPGVVFLVVTRTGDALTLVVRDRGSWREPDTAPTTRGRGLDLVRALGHCVDVRSAPGGTTVSVHWHLPAG